MTPEVMMMKNLNAQARRSERGAALVTMMLISTLLLGAGAALLTASSIGAANSMDSTNEVQAYYAAEAGLQAALNAMRGNVAAGARPATMQNVVMRADGTPTTLDLAEWLPYARDDRGRSVVRIDNGGAWNTFAAYRVNVIPNDPADPSSLVIQSTGFGPRGSTKQIQMVVVRTTFNFDPPSTITLVGDSGGDPLDGFSIGNSRNRGYTGIDQAGRRGNIPTFGFTQPPNRTTVENDVLNCTSNACEKNREAVNDSPRTSTVTGTQLPEWLRDADNARAFLDSMEETARSEERYFTDVPADIGTVGEPQFTFIDGDCSLNKDGAGLLIVTGELELRGNFNWNGLILVLGEGRLTRRGGGNGTISGALVVASFDRNDPDTEFRPSSFDTNGGGNSDIEYNSTDVLNSLRTLGVRVAGVREW